SDDARGADRPRADADLDAVSPGVDQRTRGIGSGDVAADHLDLREALLDPAHAVEHTLRMTVGGVDDDHVHPGFGQQLGTFLGAGADADRRGHAQADRKSTRLNSSHVKISYAVFCLKK